MKITVLAGGLSHEREVSLSSGSLIGGALVDKGHEVCLVDLYTGMAPDGSLPRFTREPIPPYCVSCAIPHLPTLKETTGRGELRMGEGVLSLCARADVVFIALHGDVGENGQLQACLDMHCIPYTGSGYVGSLLAMDKDLAKQLLVRAGVPTPLWVYGDLSRGVEAMVERVEGELGYPVVVKPCTGGSSVGVFMAEDAVALRVAIAKVTAYEPCFLVERRILGRELTVSILDGEVLPAVEIIPLSGFYDYENKYQAGRTIETCPAALSEKETVALREAAQRGFEALRLKGYGRLDFILDREGIPWCLEANTLPGMTPTSLLPRAAAAAGIDYGELCERMIRLAIRK